jgi:hypothetical protein
VRPADWALIPSSRTPQRTNIEENARNIRLAFIFVPFYWGTSSAALAPGFVVVNKRRSFR